MVGVAYSFVKLIIEILRIQCCIQSFARVHDIREAVIGRLTGHTLRVSMPELFNIAIFHINLTSDYRWVGLWRSWERA
jgi:hypothetical protein